MEDISLVFLLAIVTLATGVAFGVWQILRVRSAKRHKHESALAHHGDAHEQAEIRHRNEARDRTSA